MLFNISYNGLSARRKAITIKFKRFISLLLILLAFTSCQETTKGQSGQKELESKSTADTLYKPKVNIKVNRHFDEKGRMIGYDSVYTSFYSNIEGDTGNISGFHRPDSLFRWNPRVFDEPFFKWPLSSDPFFREFKHDPFDLRAMKQRMDSISRQFNNYQRYQNESHDL